MSRLEQILSEIEERSEKATPGLWITDGCEILRSESIPVATTILDRDAAFIAAARTDIPRLLKALRTILEPMGEDAPMKERIAAILEGK